MPRIPLTLSCTLLSMILLLPTHAQAAASPSQGAVTGTGRVTIKRQPELLRVQLTLTAEGKDIADATAKMKAAQAAAAKKIATLGAIDKSVEFGPSQIAGSSPADARLAYMQRMAGMRGNRGGKPAAGPPTVSLSATVKAEWALKPGTPDELLMAGYTLQESIKAAGITKKDAKPLTPEEQEAADEALALQAANGVAPTGEFTFQYVGKVSDEDRATATAEAFQKAKSQAARLAKAAGSDLGALHQINEAMASPTAGTENDQSYYMQIYLRQMGISMPSATDAPDGEAIATAPGPVELQVVVTASFDLK